MVQWLENGEAHGMTLEKAATKDQPHIWVYDPNYAIRDLDTTWKESGIVFLPIGYDIYCKQPESVGMSRMRYYIHKGVE